ncbi:major facilitator superfamily domain-containing protein [Boletus coccyginus]|nr:major facilitator superfamily domain-containing protein [Boletus coccyginus]
MSPGEKKSESFEEAPDDSVLLNEENRKAAERHVVRKLDMRLMPTVVILYLMNYIDRVAVTSARLQGLETDLNLTDVQYETVLAVLFASYSPAQIPSNMILGYISRPSFYIGACAMAWGVTSALTGVTKNFGGIVACRIFIGLPEAAFYPGSMYLLSRWYTKGELALRSAILYVGLLVSNAFGSFIAAGILRNMQGKLGIAAWRWLFYIEGAITIFIGLLAMWLLPDLPHNTRWMSPSERRLVQVRLAEDTGEADKNPSEATIFDGFKLAIRDVKVWVFMLMACCQILGMSFINFFPTLTATLGYNTTDTLLMTAPPWIFASICCIINAWNCGNIDRTGERYFHMAAWWWVTILGYIISLATMSTGGRYFSLFLMTSGFAGWALTLNWVSNSIPRPPAKRSVAMGLVNGVGNLGNVMGSYVWKASWGPGYHQSMIIALCSLVLSTILGLVMRQMLIRENKQMEREEQELTEGQRERIEEAARLEGISFEEAVRLRRGFRYLY